MMVSLLNYLIKVIKIVPKKTQRRQDFGILFINWVKNLINPNYTGKSRQFMSYNSGIIKMRGKTQLRR